MAGITLAEAKSKLQKYQEAEEKILIGQSYEIAGRSLRRADLAEVRRGIEYWDAKVKELSAKTSGRGRCVNAAPGG